MKNWAKKLIMGICVAAAAFVMTTAVFAESDGFRSGPGAVTATATDTTATTTVQTNTTEQADNSAKTVTAQTSEPSTTANKHYLTRLGGFLWFLLSVIVNFIVSSWIGMRFYRMARKSTQVSAEIRALRRDIEDKFASTVTDIDEPIVEVVNRNESYARTDEGIVMPERKTRVELNEEEEEVMRRWDEKRTEERTARAAQRNYEDDFYGEPEDSSPVKRSYQPTRRSSGIEFDDEEYTEPSLRPSRPSKKGRQGKAVLSGVSKKAKSAISNLFPFDE